LYRLREKFQSPQRLNIIEQTITKISGDRVAPEKLTPQPSPDNCENRFKAWGYLGLFSFNFNTSIAILRI
jgi:hypothetical protein